MFIESFTGVTEKIDLQIQKSCRAIGLVIVGATAPSNANLVSAKIVKEGSNTILYDQVPMLDLAEIMAQDEGLMAKNLTNYVGALPFAGAIAAFILPIGNGGAIDLDGSDYISIDFRAITSGNTYRVFALEDIESGEGAWRIDKISVAAPRTSQKWKNNGQFKLLAVPRTNFDKIQLFSTDGKRDAIVTGEELAIQSFFENDIVSVVTRSIATTPVVNLIDVIFGYDNLYLVNVENIKEFEVFCTGAAGYTFYQCNTSAGDLKLIRS